MGPGFDPVMHIFEPPGRGPARPPVEKPHWARKAVGQALFLQWAIFYQSWLDPQPPKPKILTEEGLHWSSAAKALIGSQ